MPKRGQWHGADPFSDVSQTPVQEWGARRVKHSEPTEEHYLELTASLVNRLAPPPCALAAQLGLGDLELTWDATFFEEGVDHGGESGTGWSRWGTLTIDVTSSLGGIPLRSCTASHHVEGQITAEDRYRLAAGQLAEGDVFDPPGMSLQAISDAVAERLAGYRRGLYEAVARSLETPSELQASLQRLLGAREVVRALTALGLPRLLERDEFLRSLLFGSQALPGDDGPEGLTPSYRHARDTAVPVNPRLQFARDARERAMALRPILSAAAGRAVSGASLETHRLIATTLNRLELSRLASPPPPPPEVHPEPAPIGVDVGGAG